MNDLFKSVNQVPGGYYVLKESLRKQNSGFYKDEYYQNETGYHNKSYPPEELLYKHNLARERHYVFQNYGLSTLPAPKSGQAKDNPRLLDAGCGEGYELKYFLDAGYDVYGIDFSLYGIRLHNPGLISRVIQGDILNIINKFAEEKKIFDYIIAENVLEHLSDEKEFFKLIKKVIHAESLISIRVPNDFSLLQIEAFNKGLIHKAFWVTSETGEHNYYFTPRSLINLCEEMGFKIIDCYADFPIDFFLANESASYIERPGTGKYAHKARLLIENMLYAQSMASAHALHQAYAGAGLGRNVTVMLKPV